MILVIGNKNYSSWSLRPWIALKVFGFDFDEKKIPLVVSGGVKGDVEIEGKPAILDIPVGKGRTVAFDFDPIHRYQTESDFRLVWNAILNWNDLPPVPATSR